MKKTFLYLLTAIPFFFSSCKGDREKPAVEDPYVIPVVSNIHSLRDTVFYGVLGEETAMSSIQLITDNGDTVSIYKTGKDGVEGVLLGDIRNYEDRVAVTAHIDDSEIYLTTFLNITQLEDKWKNNQGSLEILNDSTVNSSNLNYSHWRIDHCKLLLVGDVPTEYGVSQKVDTAYVDLLDEDSLHLTIPRHGKLKFGRR